jgi:DNA-binding FadR family transcriptional regulator
MLKKRSFRNGRLSERVLEQLELMLTAELPTPGDRWPREADLADRFHVSRIVIREAIKILEDRGGVEVVAGRGTFTCSRSLDRVKISLQRLFPGQNLTNADEIERMLELREVLEETVAGLAAVRGEPQDLAAMESALTDMARHDRPFAETIEADLRFHLALAKTAHNHFFEMVLEPLNQVYLQQIALTDCLTVGVDQHRSIYKEVRKGNPVGARQAMRALMQSTRRDLRKAISVLIPKGEPRAAAGKAKPPRRKTASH